MMPGPMSDLFHAYAATTFTAMTPRGELRLRVGEHHHALDALLGDYDTESGAGFLDRVVQAASDAFRRANQATQE